MNVAPNEPFTLLIPPQTHEQAQRFAAQQLTPSKGKRVYLNTVGVWAVHQYLSLMQIATSLEQSDCWQPSFQQLFTTADLLLPGRGHLECVVFEPEQMRVRMMPTAIQQQLGLVGVEVSHQLDQIQLLGCSSMTLHRPEYLERSSLRSLDELLKICSSPIPTRLLTWLQGEFDAAWQEVQILLSPGVPVFALRRSSICKRAKRLPWVILELNLEQLPRTGAYQVGLQLHPLPNDSALPLGLRLQVLTSESTVFQELAIADTNSQVARCQFQAQHGESFQIYLKLADGEYQETFEL